jgi:hypothetical protein
MIAEILNSFDLLLNDARRLVGDLSDDQMVARPVETMNHPAWIIGHIVFSCQAIGAEMGLPPWLPQHWTDLFTTGSTPVADTSAYPAKAELLAALDDAQKRLVSALTAMKEDDLAVPLPDEQYRKTLPTVRHAFVHILVAHTAIHVGQLTAWRRAVHLPTVRAGY